MEHKKPNTDDCLNLPCILALTDITLTEKTSTESVPIDDEQGTKHTHPRLYDFVFFPRHTEYYTPEGDLKQDTQMLRVIAGAEMVPLCQWMGNMEFWEQISNWVPWVPEEAGLPKWQYRQYTEDKWEELVKEAVARAFYDVGEVKAVYMQRHRYDIRISVLLNSKKYDDELVDKLLDIEYSLHLNEYGDFLLDFYHIPNIDDVRNSAIHPDAIPIFER